MINGKRFIATMLLLILSLSAFAQKDITVKGVVYDETDTPMIGVGVIQAGTSNGAVTDIDGKFSIKVPKDAVLNFSYISYRSVDVPVGGRPTMVVQMEPDKTILDEVVVVGYGTMKRSDLTGSVSSVNAKAIEDYKTSSVMQALGGQVAGVNITSADGTPGGGFDVKIRGVGTVTGDSSPLYIVDGFEVANIDFLANQDIHSIEVLKDASAAAIYGARAANGVILVTTKDAKVGRTQVTYNGSASYSILSKRMDLLSPYEFVKLAMEAYPDDYGNTYYKKEEDLLPTDKHYTSAEDYIGVKGVDWQEEAFKPTWSQSHDVSVMGGNKDTRYTASFSYFDQNGMFPNSGFTKTNGRIKLYQRINKWLTFSGSLNYTNSKKRGIGTGGGTLANLLRYRPTAGLKYSDEELLNSMYDPGDADDPEHHNDLTPNPIIQAKSVDETRKQEQWIANASLTATIIKGLTFKTSATYNANYQRNDTFFNETTSQAVRGGGPYGQSRMGRNLRWQNNNVFNYKQTFNKRHKTDFMLGHEVSFQGYEYLEGQARNFPLEELGADNLGLGATPSKVVTYRSENLRLSFFARAFYNYDDRYMLTATVRGDASTVFAPKNKWGCFPSFAFAWNIANEKFMKNPRVSNLKLRLGWGTVGNDRIPSYLSMDLYSMSKIGMGTSQSTVLRPAHLANPNLKWEGSSTANLGLDMGFFKNRLNFTIDGFVKDTKDLLLMQNLSHVTGYESQMQNIGKIRNMGVELSINSINFNKKNFGWSTDFNISFIKNTLVSLQDGNDYMMERTAFATDFKQNDYIAIVGQPLGLMYGYVFDGVYQMSDFEIVPTSDLYPNGVRLKEGVADISQHAGREGYALFSAENVNKKALTPGWIKYKDLDGDGKITEKDRTVIGHGNPTLFGGITNNFNFYGVDFSFMFQFSVGNDIYNATRMFCTQSLDRRTNQFAEVADRWRNDSEVVNASNKVPGWNKYTKYDPNSRFIEDGSFLRLKNVTLGYTFPEKWMRKIHVSKLRIYTTAQNLFCITKYSGFDPEVSMKNSPIMPGFDWGAYPKSKIFTFGLELQF